MTARDTIFALSSGAPPAAISIIRISGPSAFGICEALAGSLPESRRASVRALCAADGTLLDRALVVTFPAPRTATGEDLVELHVHGGRAVVAAVTAAIDAIPATRAAEAGEFTRRALENGIIDLTEAEGLGDLLAAETETQRRAALRTAEGGLRSLIEGWLGRLVGIGARIEVQLDFSDEDDVQTEDDGPIRLDIAILAQEIGEVLDQPPVERLRDGIRVVIAGPPNSGKSTLINAMSGREVAIVSSVLGTTRDRIEVPVARNGIAYVLTDTAGLTDHPGDEIERLGIGRARAAVRAADLVLWLGDTPPDEERYLWVHARCDVSGRQNAPAGTVVSISAQSGVLANLWTLIEARARYLIPAEDSVAVNDRQRGLLRRCEHRLLAAVESHECLIIAEDVRSALRSLDEVSGRGGMEAVLDELFARFCIGK